MLYFFLLFSFKLEEYEEKASKSKSPSQLEKPIDFYAA